MAINTGRMPKYNYRQTRYCTLPEKLRSGPILESKGIHAIFQKKGKTFGNLGKNVENLKIF